MSETERSWKEKFAPPSPPPLMSVPNPDPEPDEAAAPTEQETRPATTSRAATRPSSGRTGGKSRSRRQSTPAKDRAPKPEPAAEDADPGAGAELAPQVLSHLSDSGVDATLVSVQHRARSTVIDVQVVSATQQAAAVLAGDSLGERLGVTEVRASSLTLPGEGPESFGTRFEIFPDEAESPRGRQFMVYVPADVRDAVLAAKDEDESITEFFLAAFNEHYEKMPSMFARRKIPAGPMPQTSKVRRRKKVPTLVQMWLYLSPPQRDTLDDAVNEFDAGSRSALVTRLFQEEAQARTTVE